MGALSESVYGRGGAGEQRFAEHEARRVITKMHRSTSCKERKVGVRQAVTGLKHYPIGNEPILRYGFVVDYWSAFCSHGLVCSQSLESRFQNGVVPREWGLAGGKFTGGGVDTTRLTLQLRFNLHGWAPPCLIKSRFVAAWYE
jgi:hypothetical protein